MTLQNSISSSCRFALLFASVVLCSCSPSFWQAMGAAAGGAGASTELLVFGGSGHKTFLGCLNCSQYEAASIKNQYGTHGSRYSAASILNQYGEFGSKYASTSACNPYASDPPVIVDRSGKFYGRLTMNRNRRDATKDSNLVAWLAAICQR